MAVKSVIDIDINDEKFKRFKELFDKYNTALGKQSTMWKQAGQSQQAISTHFQTLTAQMMAQQQIQQQTNTVAKQQVKTLQQSNTLWTSMARQSKSVAGNIASASISLLKWGGLLAGGLLGGSLFGIDRMASAVGDQRKSASGLGVSIGQQKSFGINLGRFVNPDAILSGAASAANDVSKQSGLYALGVNPKQNTADVALDTLRAVRAKLLGGGMDIGTTSKAYGLDALGYSMEDLRRVKDANGTEFDRQFNKTRNDVGALNIGDKTAEKWQDFSNQLDKAGQQIFKVFVNGLEKLAGPLEKLSVALVGITEKIMNSGALKDGIAQLAKWIDELASGAMGPKFNAVLDNFLSGASDMATLMHNIAHPLDAIKNAAISGLPSDSGMASWLGGAAASTERFAFNQFADYLDFSRGLPKGTSRTIKQLESGDSMDSGITSPKGAMGLMGFMPSTAKEYGIDPRDTRQALDGETRKMQVELRRYRNNMQMALAAYNAGDGRVDTAIRRSAEDKRPGDWLMYTPKETQNYVQRGMTLIIQNNTGGSAVTAVSQQ